MVGLFSSFVFLDVMVPAAKKSQQVQYKLLYHHGMLALGVHYTLDVLHPDRYPSSSLSFHSSGSSSSGTPHSASSTLTSSTPPLREERVRIDDDVVVGVCPEDVFGGGGGIERHEMRCAYLSFYRRV